MNNVLTPEQEEGIKEYLKVRDEMCKRVLENWKRKIEEKKKPKKR
jgi:hypothetical protein